MYSFCEIPLALRAEKNVVDIFTVTLMILDQFSEQRTMYQSSVKLSNFIST
jgi:hypothetical protein